MNVWPGDFIFYSMGSDLQPAHTQERSVSAAVFNSLLAANEPSRMKAALNQASRVASTRDITLELW